MPKPGAAETHRHRVPRAIVRHPVATVSLFGNVRGGGKVEITRIVIAPPGVGGCKKGKIDGDGGFRRYALRILQFLEGSRCDVGDLPISYAGFSAFRRRVSEAARRIRRGTVVSYAGLAVTAGRPGAVRAAASVMKNNPFPLVIPCHRVVRGDGTIGGFCGRSRGTYVDMKKRLLALEGIRGTCRRSDA